MNQRYIYNMGLAFHVVAERHSQRVALHILDGTSLTYGELEALSNRIATFFLGKGLQENDVAAIFNNKTSIAYAFMLACLKIGVIYVNLDPSSPPERLAKMLDVSRPKLCWAPGPAAVALCSQAIGEVEVIDYLDPSVQKELLFSSDQFPALNAKVDGESPAYIMFTSGSTGFPKGAVMTHSNLLNFVSWSQSTFAVTPEDRVANLNPMHFDNSVFDFYSALFSGASLVPVPEDLLKNPRRLLDALNPTQCTVWFSVPSLIVYVLKMRAFKAADLPALRVMIFGGEGFPKNQLRALHDLFASRIKLVNVYGPTECTCICSSYEVGADDMVSNDLLPLGPAAPNFKHLVMSDDGRPVANGEIGELLLGGPNVGRGYYRNPEKTMEVFVQNPLHTHYRDFFYRTGDLVRYDAEQNLLHFCGRKDNQVKRMGYRIELEEIEVAIGSLPYVVENAVVFLRQGADVGRIVAHVSARMTDEMTFVSDLRAKLPPYMIPDTVVFSEVLPKNPNGKIDRRALAEAEAGA